VPIQGSAADMIKVAMINIHGWRKKSLQSKKNDYKCMMNWSSMSISLNWNLMKLNEIPTMKFAIEFDA
jgi:hypothetical protein